MTNPSLGDLGLSSEKLKKIAKLLAEERDIMGYKSMSEGELLTVPISSKSLKKSKKKQK